MRLLSRRRPTGGHLPPLRPDPDHVGPFELSSGSAGARPAKPLPSRGWAASPARPSVARLVCAAPFMAGAVVCLAVVEGFLGAAEEHFRECLAAEDHGGSYDVDG